MSPAPAPPGDGTGADRPRPRTTGPAGLVPLVLGLLALCLLNAALSFGNAWPTAWPRPAPALSAEALLIATLLGLVGAAGHRRRLSRRLAVLALAATATLLTLLHYLDVTLPALFGRPMSLYWDGRHLPGVLRLTIDAWPATRTLAVAAGVVTGFVLLVAGFVGLARVWLAGLDALPRSTRLRVLAGLGGLAIATALIATRPPVPDTGRTRDVTQQWQAALQRQVVRPVLQRAWRQVRFAIAAASPAQVSRRLPTGPSFAGNVGAIAGTDVLLVFLESYGAVTWDNPAFATRLADRRRAFDEAIGDTGNHVVSAFVRSPTFGGGSWLAHGSLLSGIDLEDPARYALLMTTDRPTLVTRLNTLGYRTTGLMPGLRSDWAESAFYRFDRLLDARRIDYRGPDFGFWRIPDQAAIARWLDLRRQEADGPPQFLFFPTITSHIPFTPIPPYQPDWTRFGSGGSSFPTNATRLTGSAGTAPVTAYSEADVQTALARPANWSDPTPAYLDAMDYSLQWLTGLLGQTTPRETLLIVIGDHQPAARVSGRDAPWDVPVHIITRSAELTSRLLAEGFREGLAPGRPILGAMHELTAVLMRTLSTD